MRRDTYSMDQSVCNDHSHSRTPSSHSCNNTAASRRSNVSTTARDSTAALSSNDGFFVVAPTAAGHAVALNDARYSGPSGTDGWAGIVIDVP